MSGLAALRRRSTRHLAWGGCRVPVPDGAAALDATLGNALCVLGQARPSGGSVPDDLLEAALIRLAAGPLGPLQRRLATTRDHPDHPVPQVRGLVIGVDVGGTDLKLVALDRGVVRGTARHLWPLPPHRFASCEAWLPAIAEPVRAFIEGVGRPAGLALSFPDLVRGGVPRSGLTGKTAGVRAALGGVGPAFWADLDRWLVPLAARLEEALGVPVAMVGDGSAAALQGGPGTLGVALGTSLGAGFVDAQGLPTGLPAYASAVVVRLGLDTARHDTVGLAGAAQQGATQKGALRIAAARGRTLPADDVDGWLRQMLEAAPLSVAGRGWLDELGAWLGDTLAELVWWVPEATTVELTGRLVASHAAAARLVEVAAGRMHGPSLRVASPTDAVFGQAEAVARWLGAA